MWIGFIFLPVPGRLCCPVLSHHHLVVAERRYSHPAWRSHEDLLRSNTRLQGTRADTSGDSIHGGSTAATTTHVEQQLAGRTGQWRARPRARSPSRSRRPRTEPTTCRRQEHQGPLVARHAVAVARDQGRIPRRKWRSCSSCSCSRCRGPSPACPASAAQVSRCETETAALSRGGSVPVIMSGADHGLTHDVKCSRSAPAVQQFQSPMRHHKRTPSQHREVKVRSPPVSPNARTTLTALPPVPGDPQCAIRVYQR